MLIDCEVSMNKNVIAVNIIDDINECTFICQNSLTVTHFHVDCFLMCILGEISCKQRTLHTAYGTNYAGSLGHVKPAVMIEVVVLWWRSKESR